MTNEPARMLPPAGFRLRQASPYHRRIALIVDRAKPLNGTAGRFEMVVPKGYPAQMNFRPTDFPPTIHYSTTPTLHYSIARLLQLRQRIEGLQHSPNNALNALPFVICHLSFLLPP